jgi:hypothetical protein
MYIQRGSWACLSVHIGVKAADGMCMYAVVMCVVAQVKDGYRAKYKLLHVVRTQGTDINSYNSVYSTQDDVRAPHTHSLTFTFTPSLNLPCSTPLMTTHGPTINKDDLRVTSRGWADVAFRLCVYVYMCVCRSATRA